MRLLVFTPKKSLIYLGCMHAPHFFQIFDYFLNFLAADFVYTEAARKKTKLAIFLRAKSLHTP
ncbi:MAG: hypothetical protein EAZ67_04130 [Cytophagales bacterium]|nr:MAG: hypothetical protein EAZ67_04130 [Cytophagales bacterium]